MFLVIIWLLMMIIIIIMNDPIQYSFIKKMTKCT